MNVRDEIKKLEEEIADLIEERQYTLRQTGVHISALKLDSLRKNYDGTIAKLEKKIEDLNTNVY